MKEWNNPQLLSLGIENTFESEEKCFGVHYCHRQGIFEDINHDTIVPGNDYLKHKWTGSECKEHNNCCCYTTQVQSES